MKIRTGKQTVLVISDTQAPFQHPDSLKFLQAIKKKYKPTRVVHIGDVTDSYHLSDYIKDPDGMSACDEIRKMHKFVDDLAKMFPKVDVLTSNHDRRIYRAAKKAGIPSHYIKDYHAWMHCPKAWKFHDELEIDGVLYTHGDESGAGGVNAALNRAKAYGQSTVSGHLHTLADIRYYANRQYLIFGFQVGCLLDHKAFAFAYSKKNIKKPIIGVGVVDKGIPIFIPMQMTARGRWTGRL